MSRKRLSMRFKDWPAYDREMWTRAFRSGDVFDDVGVAASWRPKTVVQAQYAYCRWLQYLYDIDPGLLHLRIEERITRDRVRDFVENEANRVSAVSLGAILGHLILALRAIASDSDWRWLAEIQHRQLALATPRYKRQSMVSAAELVELGHRLMASAESHATVHDIVTYRDGLMIALLASRPLRRKNFAEMRLARHIMMSGEQIRIAFDANEMKGKRPFECWVPSSLVNAFQRYLTEVRSRFPGSEGHDFVWCSMKGRSLLADGVYHAVVRRTTDAFGKSVHPHLFRDIAATAIAMHRPDQALMARDLLGHATFKTTEGHYLHAESMTAGTQYLAILESKRR